MNTFLCTWAWYWTEHLSHKEHVKNTSACTSSPIASTTWGASASPLHTLVLALCYSVAEYCVPIWARSSYTKLVDIYLNNSMWLISGNAAYATSLAACTLLILLHQSFVTLFCTRYGLILSGQSIGTSSTTHLIV